MTGMLTGLVVELTQDSLPLLVHDLLAAKAAVGEDRRKFRLTQ